MPSTGSRGDSMSSLTKMAASARSSSGCRRSSTARRRRRPRAWRRSSQRLKARTSLTIATEDERLSSREAESRLAVHERDWRKRKKKLDAAAAAVILQDYLDRATRIVVDGQRSALAETIYHEKAAWCVAAPRARRGRRRGLPVHARQSAVPRLRGRRAVRRDPAGCGQRRHRRSSRRRGRDSRPIHLSHRDLDDRPGPPSEGRRLPVRPRDDAVRGHRQDRARRRATSST